MIKEPSNGIRVCVCVRETERETWMGSKSERETCSGVGENSVCAHRVSKSRTRLTERGWERGVIEKRERGKEREGWQSRAPRVQLILARVLLFHPSVGRGFAADENIFFFFFFLFPTMGCFLDLLSLKAAVAVTTSRRKDFRSIPNNCLSEQKCSSVFN